MTYKVGKCLLQGCLNSAGMSQTELANKLGVTKQQINKYTRNVQTMSYEVAYNISVILNCDMADLYEWHTGNE